LLVVVSVVAQHFSCWMHAALLYLMQCFSHLSSSLFFCFCCGGRWSWNGKCGKSRKWFAALRHENTHFVVCHVCQC
jgi:hypothetical protein